MIRQDAAHSEYCIPALKDLGGIDDCGAKASNIVDKVSEDMEFIFCDYSSGVHLSPYVQHIAD